MVFGLSMLEGDTNTLEMIRHNDIMALPLSQMLWMKVRNFLQHNSEATHTDATLLHKANTTSNSGVASVVRRLYVHGSSVSPLLPV